MAYFNFISLVIFSLSVFLHVGEICEAMPIVFGSSGNQALFVNMPSAVAYKTPSMIYQTNLIQGFTKSLLKLRGYSASLKQKKQLLKLQQGKDFLIRMLRISLNQQK